MPTHPRSCVLAGVATVLLLLTGPIPAHAAPVAFTGTLSLSFAEFSAVVPASGTLGLNGSGGGPSLNSLTLAEAAFATFGQVQAITDPGVFPVRGLQLSVENRTGTFDGTPRGGVMPLHGVMKVCLYGACGDASENISNLSVPLTIIGQGGWISIMGAIQQTVVGAPWTTATVPFGSTTAMGFVVSAGGETGQTAVQGGHARLVTSGLMRVPLGARTYWPILGVMDLHFVPEPGTLALLGAGMAATAAAGAQRRR